jgi:flagellar biosynthesis/type III secretory pathway protein FliH
MSVVKAVNVRGSASLITLGLNSETVTEDLTFLEESDAEIETRHEPTPQERKQMLELEFSQELNLLKQEAKEKGYNEGKEQANFEVQESFDAKMAELEELIHSWSEMIEQASSVNSWVIENEDDFYALLYQATTKLLRKELSDKTYVAEIVSTLIADYSEKHIKMLAISSLHYNHLNELGIISKLDDDLTIVAEPKMLPGSFKLGLKNGFIEYDLESSLQEFKNSLLGFASEGKDSL